MNYTALSVFCFVLFVASGRSTPVPSTVKSKLDNYVTWAIQVRSLIQNELTPENVATARVNGARAMNALMGELMRNNLVRGIDQSTLSRRAQSIVQQATNVANTRGDNIMPIQLSVDVSPQKRARIAVAAFVFNQVGSQLQRRVQLLQGDLEPGHISGMLESVFATSMSMGKLVQSLQNL